MFILGHVSCLSTCYIIVLGIFDKMTFSSPQDQMILEMVGWSKHFQDQICKNPNEFNFTKFKHEICEHLFHNEESAKGKNFKHEEVCFMSVLWRRQKVQAFVCLMLDEGFEIFSQFLPSQERKLASSGLACLNLSQ